MSMINRLTWSRILHKTIEIFESNDETSFTPATDGYKIQACGTCETKGKVSVGEVIEPVCVMASCEPSAVCSGRKCDGSGVIEDNMIQSEVI